MTLPEWLNERHLKPHKTSKKEIKQLLAVFERDMADAQVKTLSADRRFTTAYNAALMVSIAALAASGYRASSEGHHYWTIQSLAHTLHLDVKTVYGVNTYRTEPPV